LLLFFLAGLGGQGEDGVFGRAAMLGKLPIQVVHVCQDQNLHPLHGVEEEHHIRPALSPSAAAPRVSHVYPSSRDAEFVAGFNTEDQVRIDAHFVFAIFMSLECIRRRQMRSSPMSLPRFSDEDPLELSLVMHIQNVQLNHQPRLPSPTRLLVEPLALRLERLCEALEDLSCRIVASVFSMDPLIGSDYGLLLRLLVPSVHLLYVLSEHLQQRR
jgi:hypothetical protein